MEEYTGAERICMECGRFELRAPGRVVCHDCDRTLSTLPKFSEIVARMNKKEETRCWSVEDFAISQGRWLLLSDFPENIQKYVDCQALEGGCLVRMSTNRGVRYIHKHFYRPPVNSNPVSERSLVNA